MSKLTVDPRPDLEDDAYLWGAALRIAAEHSDEDNEPLGALNGLRARGGRLTVNERGQVTLVRSASIGEPEYSYLRIKYLLPHLEVIKTIFDETNEKLGGQK